jgi:hypothetical protein
MAITKPKLGVILVAGLLLNLAGCALAHRIAFYLLCPDPGISLASFDQLRAGMSRDQILARLDPQRFAVEATVVKLQGPFRFQGRDVWAFDRDDVEIDLDVEDGISTDGTATVRGRLVRERLQPRDPLSDPLRPVVRRIEASVDRHRPLELFSYPVALVASIGLATVLVSARWARPEPR